MTRSCCPQCRLRFSRATAATLDTNVVFRTVANRVRARQLVDDGAVDVAIVAGDRRPVVIVRSGENDTLVALVRQSLATEALRRQLAAAGLTNSQRREDV